MTAEKEYLIYLLSCFLNGEIPEGREVDWNEIFRLADINDVGGIVASQVKKLPPEYQCTGEIKSNFNQLIGYAIQKYELKNSVIKRLKTIFNELQLDFILIKGAVIKELYPVPELRTSGDIDVIIKPESFEIATSLLKENSGKYKISGFYIKDNTALFRISDVLIELHCGADVQNAYFDNIFEVAKKCDDYEYSLSPTEHLMYVFLHLVKHIADRGAGIRMVTDIDVIIRSIEDFDEQAFYTQCEAAGELKYAKIILSYAARAFKTPVSDTFGINQNNSFYNNLTDVLLDGGSFGYLTQSTGFYHYYANTDSAEGVSNAKKLKAMLRYVFPPVSYARSYRDYAVKHPVLVPLAYVGRMKDAVIKRRKKALDAFSQIAKVDNTALEQRKFLEEIDKDNTNRSN